MYAYTVRCEFDDRQTSDKWVQWLRDEHLRDVCEAGALDAEVIRFDGEEIVCEVRYHFADRAAFEKYEREHAPRLRDEGLSRFPLSLGLRYSRATGEVVARQG